MPYLTAGLVLVGALCLLDLVLTFGVLRRLREHTGVLDKIMQGPTDLDMPSVGDTVGEFVATTVDGEQVSDESLSGRTLVAFFSGDCGACEGEIPQFAALAENAPSDRERRLVIVLGESERNPELVASLSPSARVVVDADDVVSSSFKVTFSPGYLLLDDATVAGVYLRLDDVPVAARA